jgi:predicted transcriptional regulator
MSGRQLQKEQNDLGLSPEAVCGEAGVSMSTLYKIYAGDPTVRTKSVKKVREALARMRLQERVSSDLLASHQVA